jgi:predicted amidohydrolase YtcJ
MTDPGRVSSDAAVFTGNRLGRGAEALGMRGGRVAAVGTLEAERAHLGGAQEVPLEGRVVLSGFVDPYDPRTP